MSTAMERYHSEYFERYDGEQSEHEDSEEDHRNISRYSSITTLLRNAPKYVTRKPSHYTPSHEWHDRHVSTYSNSDTSEKDRRHSIASDITSTSVETEELLDRSIYYPVNIGGELNVTLQSDDKTVLEILNTPLQSARITSETKSNHPYQRKMKDTFASGEELSKFPLSYRSVHTTRSPTDLKAFSKVSSENGRMHNIVTNLKDDIKTAKRPYTITLNDFITDSSTTSSIYGKSSETSVDDTNSCYKDSVVELLCKPSSWSNEKSYYQRKEVRLPGDERKTVDPKRGSQENDQQAVIKKSTLLSPEFHRLKDYFSNQKNARKSVHHEEPKDDKFITSQSLMSGSVGKDYDGLYKRYVPLMNSTKLGTPRSTTTHKFTNPSPSSKEQEGVRDHSSHLQTLQTEMTKIDRILKEMKSELTRHNDYDFKTVQLHQHLSIDNHVVKPVANDVSSDVNWVKTKPMSDILHPTQDQKSKVCAENSDVEVRLSRDEEFLDTSERVDRKQQPSKPSKVRTINDVSSDISVQIHSVRALLDFVLRSQNENNDELKTFIQHTEDILETELMSERSYLSYTTDQTLQYTKKLLFQELPRTYGFERSGDEAGNDSDDVDRRVYGRDSIQYGSEGALKRFSSYSNLPVENRSILDTFPEKPIAVEDGQTVHEWVSRIDTERVLVPSNIHSNLKNERVDGNAYALLSRGHRDGQLESLKQMLFSLQEIEQENRNAEKTEHTRTRVSQHDSLKGHQDKTLTRAYSHLENLKNILQERRDIFDQFEHDEEEL